MPASVRLIRATAPGNRKSRPSAESRKVRLFVSAKDRYGLAPASALRPR